jgi:hypothetical protein
VEVGVVQQGGELVHAAPGVGVVGAEVTEQLHGGQGQEKGVAIGGIRLRSGEGIADGGEPVRRQLGEYQLVRRRTLHGRKIIPLASGSGTR